jgi:hypothetical protein
LHSSHPACCIPHTPRVAFLTRCVAFRTSLRSIMRRRRRRRPR